MKSHNVWALAAIGVALAGPAFATVSVRLDQNTVMDLRGPAGTVLIGNPAVVDVNLITPSRIAILGKGYGQTNVIVTDRMGHVIFQQEVDVSRASGDHVSVYRGGVVANFTCSPTCEAAQAPGEDNSGSSPSHAQPAPSGAGGGKPAPPPQ
ncbi:MAG TPA: pilus assembly protein N-terminal domain-containing protein [Caulobacteraceae bacterium]